MLTPTLMLGGILLPAVLCAVSLGLTWRLWRPEDEARPLWSAPLGIGLGFLGGFITISGVGALPSEGRTLAGLDWTFWGCLLVTGIAALRCALEGWRWHVANIVLWCVTALLLTRVVANSAEASGLLLYACLLLWFVLELGATAFARTRPGAATPLALWAVAAGLAVVTSLSGSAKLGQLCGALAATLGAACVLAWWRPRLKLGAGGSSVTVFALVALGLCAHFYSYTTRVDLLLLAAGLMTPLALRLPALRDLGGVRRAVLALTLALLPIVIAVVHAALAFEPDPYAGY